MTLAFTKMQGLGNDFVVLDGVSQELALSPALIRALADRRFGIGCDQVLLAEQSDHPQADFRYRIWNADGGEVEHCGNGVRCMARFLIEQGLTTQTELCLETLSGLTHVRLEANDEVTVNMGPPVLTPVDVPFRDEPQALTYPLLVDGQSLSIGVVSMGNPHAVLTVMDIHSAPVARLGPAIESHPDFPKRVNAGFMETVNREKIRLRVYERGVGETLACGTGACAAVVSGILNGVLDATVQVELTGGTLVIHWEGEGQPVWMTGPGVTVFEGRWAAGAS